MALGRLGQLFVEVGVDTTKAEAGLGRLQGSVQRHAGAIRGIGLGLTALGAGASAIVYKSVQAFESFEEQLVKTGAVAGAIGEQIPKDLAVEMGLPETVTSLEALRVKALEIGRELPQMPEDIARAMYGLASAGLKTKDIIAAIGPVAELSAAQLYDMGETSEMLVTTIKTFGLTFEDTAEMANIFDSAIRSSMMTMGRLQEAMKFAGPVMSQLGYSVKETVAWLAAFKETGIDASMVGTSIRMAMNRLLDPMPEVIKAAKELGIELFKTNSIEAQMADQILKLEETIEGTTASISSYEDALKTLKNEYKETSSAIETQFKAKLASAAQSTEAAESTLDRMRFMLQATKDSFASAADVIETRYDAEIEKARSSTSAAQDELESMENVLDDLKAGFESTSDTIRSDYEVKLRDAQAATMEADTYLINMGQTLRGLENAYNSTAGAIEVFGDQLDALSITQAENRLEAEKIKLTMKRRGEMTDEERRRLELLEDQEADYNKQIEKIQLRKKEGIKLSERETKLLSTLQANLQRVKIQEKELQLEIRERGEATNEERVALERVTKANEDLSIEMSELRLEQMKARQIAEEQKEAMDEYKDSMDEVSSEIKELKEDEKILAEERDAAIDEAKKKYTEDVEAQRDRIDQQKDLIGDLRDTEKEVLSERKDELSELADARDASIKGQTRAIDSQKDKVKDLRDTEKTLNEEMRTALEELRDSYEQSTEDIKDAMDVAKDALSDNKEALKALNKEYKEFPKVTRNIRTDIMPELIEGLEGMTDAQEKASMAVRLFGLRSGPIFASAVGNVEGALSNLNDALFVTNEEGEEVAGLTETLGAMMDTSAGKTKLMQSALQIAQVEMGEQMAPTIDALKQKVTDMSDKFASAGEGFQSLAAQGTMAAGAIGMIGGPLLMALPTITAAIGGAGGVAGIGGSLVALATGPIGIAIAGVAAFALAYKTNFLGTKDAVDGFVRGAKKAFKGLGTWWKEKFMPGWKAAGGELKKLWDEDFLYMKTIFTAFAKIIEFQINMVVGFFKILGQTIGWIFEKFKIFESIGALVGGIFKAMGDFINAFNMLIKGDFKGAMGEFGEMFKHLNEAFGKFFLNMAKGFVEVGKVIWEALSKAGATIVKWLGGLVDWGYKLPGNIAIGIARATGNFMVKVHNFLVGIKNKIVTWLAGAVQWGIDLVAGIGRGIVNTAGNAWSAAVNMVVGIKDRIWNILKQAWDWGKTTVIGIAEGIWNWVSSLWNKTVSMITGVKDRIWNVVKNAWKWGKQIITGMIDGIKKWLGSLWKTLGDVGSGIADFFTGGSSPAKVGPLARFEETAGPDFVQSLANGILGAEDKATRAAAKLAKDVQDAAAMEGDRLKVGVEEYFPELPEEEWPPVFVTIESIQINGEITDVEAFRRTLDVALDDFNKKTAESVRRAKRLGVYG